MRVAEDAAIEHLHVSAQLAGGVETPAGVVEVDVVARVELGVLRLSQFVDPPCRRVGREPSAKILLGRRYHVADRFHLIYFRAKTNGTPRAPC